MTMKTPRMRPLDRDRLALTARDEAAKASMAVLHVVQQEEPEIIMAGAACLFVALCKRSGLDPEDMVQMANKMLRPEPFHQKGNIQMEVLRDFAGLRMAGAELEEIA